MWWVGKMGEAGQDVQIPRHKVEKSWGDNRQHGDSS